MILAEAPLCARRGSLETGVRRLVVLILFLLAGAFSAPAFATQFDVLSPRDAAAYARAFQAAGVGDGIGTAAALAETQNRVLEGHVLRVALLRPGAQADYAQLAGWLDRFADQAGADAVQAAALKLKPADAPDPRAAVIPPWRSPGVGEGRRDADYRPNAAGPGVTQADRNLYREAREHFYGGRVAEALAIVETMRDGPLGGHASWVAGLAYFQQGQFVEAAARFEETARWPHGDDWQRAGGGYWAARSWLAAGRAQRALGNLQIAAARPLTFYGQLALAHLGRYDEPRFPDADVLERGARNLVERRASAQRAAALAQLGRAADAEAELVRAWREGRSQDDESLLALAELLDLPQAQRRLAELAPGAAGLAALFPTPGFRPDAGYRLDRALLYGVIRQESRFDARATSRAGARGLMQIMPATAAWMTGDSRFRANPNLLYEPGLNMSLGQSYLIEMLGNPDTGGCLIKTLAAYNAGPGNLQKFRAMMVQQDDPLLFLETMPIAETRIYVEKVMTNVWLYHKRFGQPAPSLRALAQGRTPVYTPVEAARVAEVMADPAVQLASTAAVQP